MSAPAGVKQIGVFGHVGNGNLGDEATFWVVIQHFKRRYPSAAVRCFTSNPDDTSKRHNVPAFPIARVDARRHDTTSGSQRWPIALHRQWRGSAIARIKRTLKRIPLIYPLLKTLARAPVVLRAVVNEPRFLLDSYHNLQGLDLLIIAGSQQLIDYVAGGAWNHPYTLFKWVMLARARRVAVAFMSVGVGPVRSALGRAFIRWSLSVAAYRSYRDDASRTCAAELGVQGDDRVVPDLVYGLPVEGVRSDAKPVSSRGVVGINPLPFSDPDYFVGASAAAGEQYGHALAAFALWLIERGYGILFFPTQLRADPPAIEEVLASMARSRSVDVRDRVIGFSVQSLDELLSAISMTDIVVATRYHAVVISHVLNRPVLGIAYAEKTTALMEQMGQSEFAVDIARCGIATLQERFIVLEARKAVAKRILAQRVCASRAALDAQYEAVGRLLHGGSG